LWIAGSHSLKREKPSANKPAKGLNQLATMVRETNRFLLARVPLAPGGPSGALDPRPRVPDPSAPGRNLTAAQVFGTGHTNLLVDALDDDRHLARFLSIPGKENGFDIEGLAATRRSIFLGLRGPVLAGWAVILEVAPAPLSDRYLTLEPIGPKKRLYRKHFLDLEGLGIRELALHGDDLLVLAGPTMDLDGRVLVYRWRDAAKAKRPQIVQRDDLDVVLEFQLRSHVPGRDHAEGIALIDGPRGEPELLVVYDSPAEDRMKGKRSVRADVFPLER
jgi:hypothetical protein